MVTQSVIGKCILTSWQIKNTKRMRLYREIETNVSFYCQFI